MPACMFYCLLIQSSWIHPFSSCGFFVSQLRTISVLLLCVDPLFLASNDNPVHLCCSSTLLLPLPLLLLPSHWLHLHALIWRQRGLPPPTNPPALLSINTTGQHIFACFFSLGILSFGNAGDIFVCRVTQLVIAINLNKFLLYKITLWRQRRNTTHYLYVTCTAIYSDPICIIPGVKGRSIYLVSTHVRVMTVAVDE